MIKYELHNNKELLIVKYIGDISKSSLISFFKFCLDKGYLSTLKEILADYRDAKELYSLKDIIEITEARKITAKGLDEIKTIFLVSNPKNTVIAHFYSIYYKDHSEVKICSTINACVKYLSLNISNNELERKLVNPKFEYSQ